MGNVERIGDVGIKLARAARGRPRELRARALVLEELAVLVEDGVGPQVRLQDVGARHRDFQELRAKVEAALERDVDGLVERHSIGRAIVVLGHNFQRPIERRRRR